jgi:hypothetical protein
MKHLSTDERLALIEGPGHPRHPHLAACRRCRSEIADARALLGEARAADVPEPSPLFWDHFSARVAARLDEAPRVDAAPHRAPWRILLPLAAGVMALVMMVAVGRDRVDVSSVRPSGGDVASKADAPRVEPLTEDGGWDVLGRFAADFDVDTLRESLGPSSSTMEAGVWQLNENERAELTRLLRAEMQAGRSGS